MLNKTITKNYIYNTIYQILIIILPLITTPYVSRILGANNIGIYGYTLSISTYFALFGTLGITIYGQREIAYCQDKKDKYSKIFWEIVFLRIIAMLIAMTVFFLIFIFRENDYQIYYFVLLFDLFGMALDINWFFQGLEEFKTTIIRNVIVRLVCVVCIFLFVKTPDDLIIYFVIYVLSTLIGNISLWLNLPKFLSKVEFSNLKMFRHLKFSLLLFVPQLAIQIYTVLDKTMLGLLIVDKSEVGFYEQTQKLIKLLLTIVLSLGTIMMPRIANSYANKDDKKIQDYMEKSLRATFLLALPLIFGIIVISDEFVPLFFGDNYDKVIVLIKILSPIILMIGLSNNIGMQYLLPTKQQNLLTISVVAGAIINFIINFLLIPNYGSIGASVATVIAETSVTIMQMFMTKSKIKYIDIFKKTQKYLYFSLIMFALCYSINFLGFNHICKLLVKIFIGMLSYFLMLALSKDIFVDKLKKILKM